MKCDLGGMITDVSACIGLCDHPPPPCVETKITIVVFALITISFLQKCHRKRVYRDCNTKPNT